MFASCSTQVQQYLLKQCWRWNSALSVSPEAFDTQDSIIETWPGGEHSFSPAMALIFGVHASRWKKRVWLIDGVPTEFRELALEEDACFGPNPPIATPLPTLEDLAQGRKPAGAFVLAVDSQGTDPMAAFAASVLAVANRVTMPTLCQVNTDWTFDSATLFSPNDFYHPKLCITTWEQGKIVWRMEGDYGKNANTMSKWVQLKDGIPTEVIGVPTAAPNDPKLAENDADSGPPDPALRPQQKNPPRPGQPHNLSNRPSDASSSPPAGGQKQDAFPSNDAYFVSPTVEGPHQNSTDDPSLSSAPPVGSSGDNPNYEYQAGQDNLLANSGSTAQSVCAPPSPDAAGLWTPAPTKRRRASTKHPPASPPHDSSQDPKKSKDSAFSSPMNVEDFVMLPPIKTEGKEDPPPPLQHIRPMEYFRRTELVADVPPYLQHFLCQPYQSKGNHWATGDSSLMNSDLTVALHRLFLLMTGYPPSEDQQVRLRREGFPEALLYDTVIHLIEGWVIQSRVGKLMLLDEYFYLKIVLWRISLT